ncbi:hypothetical protein NE237_005684 [Protea cynaroides]|uniref:Uncharacterized protein n=1 Tax=Protea cynaroides TaxID=273540 RepID=A0A9Q0QUQ8_9MAGN|nr:hypothetical protein NE237_005684 [Protea cynaroides]
MQSWSRGRESREGLHNKMKKPLDRVKAREKGKEKECKNEREGEEDYDEAWTRIGRGGRDRRLRKGELDEESIDHRRPSTVKESGEVAVNCGWKIALDGDQLIVVVGFCDGVDEAVIADMDIWSI